VLSPDYLESEFGTAEWTEAWSVDPLSAQRKLLTVRVRPCGRPDFLRPIVSVDLFGVAESEARTWLRRLVAGAVTGRAKPETAPLFPGAGRAIAARPLFPGALPSVWKVAQQPHWEGARGLGCSSWRGRTAGRSTDQVGLTPFDRVSR
jgi:hypothetical protein